MHDRAIGKRLGVAPYKACECGSIRDRRTEHVPRDNLMQNDPRGRTARSDAHERERADGIPTLCLAR